MDPGLVTVAAAAAAAVLLALCAALVLALRTTRRLRSRLDELERRVPRPEQSPSPREDSAVARQAGPARGAHAHDPEYVITTAGLPALREEQAPQVDARQFASVALGESLVRVASLAHGIRRALSAESRNRIGFEVRREIRRARRQRRRDLKEARRHLRAAQREEDAA